MAHKKLSRSCLALLLIFLFGHAVAETQPTVTPVANNLGVPWGMVWVDKDRILFTERSGRAGIVQVENGNVRWLGGLPEVAASGQGGLMDVAIAAEYHPNDWIYFTYSKLLAGKAVTALARAKLSGDKLVDWQDMLVTKSATGTSRHFGSRIVFDGKGHLFFSVGERGERSGAQNLNSHEGSILRLNIDGSVPKDNPFVGRADALPEIYSYGHRNPQGLCYDKERDGLWASEHGPRGGDEVNWILPGRNYGWPEISHGKEYWGPVAVGDGTERDDIEPARKVYIPSIAPSSLLCYHGDLLQGSLALTHLNWLQLDKNGNVIEERRLLDDWGERIRALLEGPAGEIYLSTDSGKIVRLAPLK